MTKEESGIFVPTTNLAEAKHASMCVGVGFKRQISLYKATRFDMSMAILQSVRCNTYLKGIHALCINYSVIVVEFPHFTCEGFLKRESKRLTYIPCKHLYYVYLKILGLDSTSHDFIHQAALTKVELFWALSGRRCTVTI